MKKIIAMLMTVFISLMMFAGPASATGTPQPDAENKKVVLCHSTSSATNPYNKIEVSVMAFYNAGHISDVNDIWKAFSYTDKRGNVVNVDARGDTSLLAFDDCQKPKVDEEIAVPAVSKVDKCEVGDDSVTPVRDDEKYATVVGPRVNDSITVTFTSKDGFTFPDGKKVVTVTVDFPNNADCDLPETGGKAEFNTALGAAALGGVLILGMALLFTRKRS